MIAVYRGRCGGHEGEGDGEDEEEGEAEQGQGGEGEHGELPLHHYCVPIRRILTFPKPFLSLKSWFDSQTGTFTSEANCSTICFLKVSNSPNMTQNTEEASNAQFPAIEQAAFSKCDCPGDSTTALSLPVTHTCVTHFVHNHKILPPFLSITIPAGKYTLPKFNFWNDSLLCHQSLCYCLRNRCSLNFSRKELSGKRKFLLPTFI